MGIYKIYAGIYKVGIFVKKEKYAMNYVCVKAKNPQ